VGEVLSQSEIDNLLAALSTGELDVDSMQDTEEKQARNYDFNRPTKFSKEHLRTLEIIFEHYGRLISTNLPVYLRKNIQVSVASSETVAFSEFSNALSNPVILGILNFTPLSGNIIIELSTNLGYAMIDRMLGGDGAPLERVREFSEIELSIISRIMTLFTQLLRDPWKNVVDLTPVLSKHHSVIGLFSYTTRCSSNSPCSFFIGYVQVKGPCLIFSISNPILVISSTQYPDRAASYPIQSGRILYTRTIMQNHSVTA